MFGFNGNAPASQNGNQPSTVPGGGPGGMDSSGKAGKAFVKAIDSLSFDARVFAYYVVSVGGKALRKRILDVVFAIVRTLGDAYDSGDMDNETTQAKRLIDTMELYGMDDQ